MDENSGELTEMTNLDIGKKRKNRESPYKPRVTFQLGSEEDGTSTHSYNDKNSFETEEGDCFKRGISTIMQDSSNITNELTKDSEKDDDDDINKDLASVTKYLLKKSSIYAVSQVGHADSPYRKILWIVVLTAGLFGCGYEIYRFLVLYFQYPVVVNLQVETKRNLEFPAVTICNLNRMRTKYEICLERNAFNNNCSTIYPEDESSISFSERSKTASCFDESDLDLSKRITFLEKYSQLDSLSRQRFGHQFNDLIRSCSFNGEPCYLGYFSYFQSLKYGNCYTFNKFSSEDDTVIKTSVVGIMSGLELTLNFELESYLPDVTSSVGARIIIHDPRDDPNPEEDGMNISPGFETTLAVKQKSISRLSAPYKDHCVNYRENEALKGNNRNECVKFCMQEESFAQCSCIDPAGPPFRDYKHCNMTNATEACCLSSALNSIAINGLPCNCPLPCFSTTYDTQLSTAVWPCQSNYFNSFCIECAAEKKSAKEDKQFFQDLRKKEGRVKIYYSTLEQSVYEQKPMFQDSELYSHLGGQLGLWLGLSIVAAFELVENIIYVCKYFATLTC